MIAKTVFAALIRIGLHKHFEHMNILPNLGEDVRKRI
jgi:hypothetical protein